jgi:hypothetical protein
MAGAGANIGGGFSKLTGVEESSFSAGIDGFLQAKLQKDMPDKNVKVYNGAVVVQSVVQSRLSYERVRHLKPDWVVSMDGYNDYIAQSDRPIMDHFIATWRKYPANVFPYKQVRWLTEKSAALYFLSVYILQNRAD